MRLSEVFLRIGSSFTAWMVIYAYFIWLAVVQRVDCGVDGEEIFRLLMGMAPVAAGASFALGLTRPFAEIHRILRWLGIPLIALLILTVPVIWQVFNAVNIDNAAICTGNLKANWQPLWAPLQMAVTALCIWKLLRTWRTATIEENDAVA